MNMALKWSFPTFFRRRWHVSEAACLTGTLCPLFCFCGNGIKTSGLFNLMRCVCNLFSVGAKKKKTNSFNFILNVDDSLASALWAVTMWNLRGSELRGFIVQDTGILCLLNNSKMFILDKRSYFSDSPEKLRDHHGVGRHIQNLRTEELSYIHLCSVDKNWFILDYAIRKSSLKTQMEIRDPTLLFRKLFNSKTKMNYYCVVI